MSNPYTLVFGQRPPEIIERTAQAERIISDFSQESERSTAHDYTESDVDQLYSEIKKDVNETIRK